MTCRSDAVSSDSLPLRVVGPDFMAAQLQHGGVGPLDVVLPAGVPEREPTAPEDSLAMPWAALLAGPVVMLIVGLMLLAVSPAIFGRSVPAGDQIVGVTAVHPLPMPTINQRPVTGPQPERTPELLLPGLGEPTLQVP